MDRHMQQKTMLNGVQTSVESWNQNWKCIYKIHSGHCDQNVLLGRSLDWSMLLKCNRWYRLRLSVPTKSFVFDMEIMIASAKMKSQVVLNFERIVSRKWFFLQIVRSGIWALYLSFGWYWTTFHFFRTFFRYDMSRKSCESLDNLLQLRRNFFALIYLQISLKYRS